MKTTRNVLMMLVLLLWLPNLKVSSQTISINVVGKDTSICFSLPKAKYLLKKNYEVEKYKSLLDICDQSLVEAMHTVEAKEEIITDQAEIIKNKDEVIALNDYVVGKLKAQVASEKKKVRIQKVYKWISIGVGAAVTAGFGYYVVTH